MNVSVAGRSALNVQVTRKRCVSLAQTCGLYDKFSCVLQPNASQPESDGTLLDSAHRVCPKVHNGVLLCRGTSGPRTERLVKNSSDFERPTFLDDVFVAAEFTKGSCKSRHSRRVCTDRGYMGNPAKCTSNQQPRTVCAHCASFGWSDMC